MFARHALATARAHGSHLPHRFRYLTAGNRIVKTSSRFVTARRLATSTLPSSSASGADSQAKAALNLPGKTYEIAPALRERILQYSLRKVRRLGLREMISFGRKPTQAVMLQSAIFLADEIPVRLARRFAELEQLPYGLSTSPAVERVKSWYAQSFKDLVDFGDEIARIRANIPSENALHGTGSGWLKWIRGGSNQNGTTARWTPPPAPWDPAAAMSPEQQPHSVPPMTQADKIPSEESPEIPYVGVCADESLLAVSKQLNDRFAKILHGIVERHNPVVLVLAKAISELHTTHPRIHPLNPNLQGFLERFHRARVGIRLLIGHHIALYTQCLKARPGRHQRSHSPEDNPSSRSTDAILEESRQYSDGFIGILCTKTRIEEVAIEAADAAADVCEGTFGVAPLVQVDLIIPVATQINGEATEYDNPEDAISADLLVNGFTYVPSHLHYVLFELLKNAMRAVVEKAIIEMDEEAAIKQRDLQLQKLKLEREAKERGEDSAHQSNTNDGSMFSRFLSGLGIQPDQEGHSSLSDILGVPPMPSVEQLPPVIISAEVENDHIILKIKDQGTGIPSSEMSRIFQYSYTTVGKRPLPHSLSSPSDSLCAPPAPRPPILDIDVNRTASGRAPPKTSMTMPLFQALNEIHEEEKVNSQRQEGEQAGIEVGNASTIDETIKAAEEHERSAPMAGFGYGLPLSRLYARYFLGDLWVESKEGIGTEAIILIRKNFDGVEPDSD
ncbi:mitochondrial branched-chain alpha-ketoacid dehydrogenase kinase-domain-containing protein [Cladochytrium replicatum]|nr:mitochondrial branched-chain alpha-ketoacid dehydrogenase kinase-domain-containing protein [Cladochytrium replicatum]